MLAKYIGKVINPFVANMASLIRAVETTSVNVRDCYCSGRPSAPWTGQIIVTEEEPTGKSYIFPRYCCQGLAIQFSFCCGGYSVY